MSQRKPTVELINKPRFRTNYNAEIIPSEVKNRVLMTMPGLALTNKQHLEKARNGLAEKTMKVIYDPHDILPDVRSMDLVERDELLRNAKTTVEKIKKAKEDHENKMKAAQKAQAEQRIKDEEARLIKLIQAQGGKNA